jgi:hypothetical protein
MNQKLLATYILNLFNPTQTRGPGGAAPLGWPYSLRYMI